MKKQDLDFEVTQDFFTEMKYTILNYLNWKAYRHIGFCDFRYRTCPQ